AIKGRRIVIAIEPEPGCHFDRATDLVDFFDRYIPLEDRRYLTVCHDVCHAAVMNEPQSEVLALYHANQMVVGKFQISSAITVNWAEMSLDERQAALTQLSGFAEDRYLHQTGQV